MKAFVSYSIGENNDIIVTMLATKLREKKFNISTSQNFYSPTLDYPTMNEIITSHLFVGIITGTAQEVNRVLAEWNYAVQNNIPNLLLIEDTVPVHQEFTGNFIRFNRLNPFVAIHEINRRMTPQPVINAQSNNDDIVPWILGGAALLAIIGLLSIKEK